MTQSAHDARAKMLDRLASIMGVRPFQAELIVTDLEDAAARHGADHDEAVEMAIGALEVFMALYVRLRDTEVALTEAEAWIELDPLDRDLGADWWCAAVQQRYAKTTAPSRNNPSA